MKLTQYGLGVAFALSAGLAASVPASAVTVNIDIRTEGEPVPGTTITFETTDGKEVPQTELTALVEEDKPATEAPEKQETPPATTPPAEEETPSVQTEEPEEDTPHTPFRAELPDDLIGQDIIVVVRKGDELIKREPVRVDPEKPEVAIEAYDPADANLAVEISQPKICRRGRDCDQQISVSNNGSGIYKGPVFLSGTMHGTLKNNSDAENQWWCGYAGRGKQLCHNDVSLQPGETAKWDVKVRLGNRISQRATSCLDISSLNEEPSGRVDQLLQAVQLGLTQQGIKTGRPDGIIGPKTQTAINHYLEQKDLPATTTLQDVFQSIYGMSSARLARLEGPEDPGCTKLSLVKEKRKIRKKASRKKKRRARREVVVEEYYEDEEFDEPRPRVRIGIGFGGSINRGHRRRREHSRPNRRRREHSIERRRREPRRIERRRHRRWQD